MTRVTDPQVSFADFALQSQGLQLDPALQAISDFLDDQAEIVDTGCARIWSEASSIPRRGVAG